MEQLIKEVSERAGITPEQARTAVTHTAGYLKNRLPYVFHGQLDHLLAGGTMSENIRNKLLALKEDFEAAARNLGKKAEEFADDVKKKVDEVFKKQ